MLAVLLCYSLRWCVGKITHSRCPFNETVYTNFLGVVNARRRTWWMEQESSLGNIWVNFQVKFAYRFHCNGWISHAHPGHGVRRLSIEWNVSLCSSQLHHEKGQVIPRALSRLEYPYDITMLPAASLNYKVPHAPKIEDSSSIPDHGGCIPMKAWKRKKKKKNRVSAHHLVKINLEARKRALFFFFVFRGRL